MFQQSESSRERKFQGAKVPGSESSTYFRYYKRKYVGTKVPVTLDNCPATASLFVRHCCPVAANSLTVTYDRQALAAAAATDNDDEDNAMFVTLSDVIVSIFVHNES